MHLEATAPGKMLCSKVFHWCLLLYICPYWPIHIVELIQYNACGSEFVSSIKIGSWGCVQFEKWVNRDQEPQKIVQWGGGQPTPTPNVPLPEITLKDSKTMSKGMTNRRFEHNTFGRERVYMLMRVLIDLQRTHCLFPNKDHCLFPNKDRSNVLQLYMLKPCPEYPEWYFIRIFEVNDSTTPSHSCVAGLEQVCRGVEVPFALGLTVASVTRKYPSCFRNSEMIIYLIHTVYI